MEHDNVPMDRPQESVSRRDFVKRAGIGSAAAAGMVWAAPKISTVNYVRRAAVGSPPPRPTTGPPTQVSVLDDRLSVSETSPCVGGALVVHGEGFAPKTGVTVEIDSSAHPIALATTDRNGAFDHTVEIPRTGPAGHHNLRAVGIQPGGQTLVLVTPITIKTEAECASTTADPGTRAAKSVSDPSPFTGSLPFTGGEVTDLALLGGAAVLGGRALYGIAKRPSGEIDGADR